MFEKILPHPVIILTLIAAAKTPLPIFWYLPEVPVIVFWCAVSAIPEILLCSNITLHISHDLSLAALRILCRAAVQCVAHNILRLPASVMPVLSQHREVALSWIARRAAALHDDDNDDDGDMAEFYWVFMGCLLGTLAVTARYGSRRLLGPTGAAGWRARVRDSVLPSVLTEIQCSAVWCFAHAFEASILALTRQSAMPLPPGYAEWARSGPHVPLGMSMLGNASRRAIIGQVGYRLAIHVMGDAVAWVDRWERHRVGKPLDANANANDDDDDDADEDDDNDNDNNNTSSKQKFRSMKKDLWVVQMRQNLLWSAEQNYGA